MQVLSHGNVRHASETTAIRAVHRGERYRLRNFVSPCRAGRGCTPRSCISPCRAGRGCTPRSRISTCRGGMGCTARSLSYASRANTSFAWVARIPLRFPVRPAPLAQHDLRGRRDGSLPFPSKARPSTLLIQNRRFHFSNGLPTRFASSPFARAHRAALPSHDARRFPSPKLFRVPRRRARHGRALLRGAFPVSRGRTRGPRVTRAPRLNVTCAIVLSEQISSCDDVATAAVGTPRDSPGSELIS